MKKFVTICILAGMLLLFSGCLVVGFENSGGGNAVQGTGDRVSNNFTIPSFTGIDISGGYTVVYRYSANHAVIVEMHENLFNYLNVGVQNGVLRIDSTRSFRTGSGERPHIYVYAPFLDSVAVSGAITAEGWDTIRTGELHVNIGGSADGTISMEVENFEISVAGATSLHFTGTATSAIVNVAGAGSIYAEYLQTENARVTIAGTGTVEIAVSETLDVTVGGVGSVTYIGDPQVSQTIAGMGSVRRRD